MKSINAALLSYGMSGKVFHAPFIHKHPGFTLLGSWERSNQLIQTDYPYVKSYAQLEDILNDKTVDVVVVNTPTYTHFDYSKRALEAGKHIIVEKSFTATADEALTLQQLAEEKGLKISVFQNRRWDSDFKTVQEVIQKGLLGQEVEATLYYARYTPELSPKKHKEIDRPGAGIVHDLGPHLIDQALVLFGMPDSVFADVRITRSESEVADYFDILLSYSQMSVHVKAGYFYRESVPAYAIHGRQGTFLKSRADVQEDQLKAGIKPEDSHYGIEPLEEEGLLHTAIEGKVIKEKLRTHRGDYSEYYEAAYQYFAGNGESPVSAQDGVNVMRIIDAAYESARKGQTILL
jgi:scyllo-inositol 2-dehydrogenase (NADP+)